MKQEDREALHNLLDAVIDKIEAAPEAGDYVAFNISSYSYGVRASEETGNDWLMYHDYYGKEWCTAKHSEEMALELAEVKFSTTKQDADITEDQ